MENLVQNLIPALEIGTGQAMTDALMQSPLVSKVEQKDHLGKYDVIIADYYINTVHVQAVHVQVGAFSDGIVINLWENIALGNVAKVIIYTKEKKAIFELDIVPF